MAKVTSKYQVTVPKRIADQYGIRPGDDIDWVAAGETIRVIPGGRIGSADDPQARLRLFDQATERQQRRNAGRRARKPQDRGWTREESTAVAALADTDILVYRYDDRFPDKHEVATEILRRGIADDSVRLPHQAIVEFVAAVTRSVRGEVILPLSDALREAEELLRQFTVLYPNEAIVRSAVRGCAAYQLNWFGAHLWSYAEYYGLDTILSEDFEHDRLYGSVRIVNPFIDAAS